MDTRSALSFRSDFQLERWLVRKLATIIDSPRSLTVFLLLQNKEYEQLLDLEIDPRHYEDPQKFREDYLITVILSKSPSVPLGVDRRQAAIDSFLLADAECENVNKRFTLVPPSELNPYVGRAKTLISRILGPLTRDKLNLVEKSMKFGPGATTGVPGRATVKSDKYDAPLHLTEQLIPFYRVLLGERWWQVQSNPVIAKGSVFFTVPKKAKTDRGAAKEATLNNYVQSGTGALFRQQLRRFGVDLRVQEINQELSKIARSHGLATIDLSSASDLIAGRVVADLIPEPWFKLLQLSRAEMCKVPGKGWVKLHKFSSMGNGYTFELETLIFFGLALACTPPAEWDHVNVYGDDIIVPQTSAHALIDTLEFLGFRVNTKKSFLAGNFFESCGAHWFKDQDVRPFYLRGSKRMIRDPDDDSVHPQIPYSVQVANALRLWASQPYDGMYCDGRFREVWRALYKSAPRIWRTCLIPPQLGDLGFIVSKQEAWNRTPRGAGLEGYKVRTISARPMDITKSSLGRLLVGLTLVGSPDSPKFTRGKEPRRGLMGLPRPRWTKVHTWSDGLTWV